MKILIGSPVYQNPRILTEFLKGIYELEKGNIDIDYCFVDDNTDEKSTMQLKMFSEKTKAIIISADEILDDEADYNSHQWDSKNLYRVALFKNKIIEYAVKEKYDYLLLIDSDIVMDRRSLLQLISDKKDIVSNVFWNQWVKNGKATPQCFWIPDIYDQFEKFNTKLSFEVADKIRNEMIETLKTPGLYEVDGLGACTLIKREALENGVNFTKIPNLKIPGEDRDFCIRAGVLGYQLFIDTHYPAYHISKEQFIDRVDEFKRDGYKYDMCLVFDEVENKPKRFQAIRNLLFRVGSKLVRDYKP